MKSNQARHSSSVVLCIGALALSMSVAEAKTQRETQLMMACDQGDIRSCLVLGGEYEENKKWLNAQQLYGGGCQHNSAASCMKAGDMCAKLKNKSLAKQFWDRAIQLFQAKYAETGSQITLEAINELKCDHKNDGDACRSVMTYQFNETVNFAFEANDRTEVRRRLMVGFSDDIFKGHVKHACQFSQSAKAPICAAIDEPSQFIETVISSANVNDSRVPAGK